MYDFPTVTGVVSAVDALRWIRETFGSIPHPDDSGASIWSLTRDDYLFSSAENADAYDRLIQDIVSRLGDSVYDLTMTLNDEVT